MKDIAETGTLAALRAAAEAAAGAADAPVYRAQSYFRLWRASHGVCTFALIAAHGALWGNWYLRAARIMAMGLAVLDLRSPLTYAEKMRQFDAFVACLWEINRQVMVATHMLVHSVSELTAEEASASGLPEDLHADMGAAIRRAAAGETISDTAKRDLYYRHFRWEQKRVVGGLLTECFEQMDWQLMRGLCLRPWVWFAYFRPGKSLNFKNFMDEDERVDKGLAAFDRAERLGWNRVDRRLRLALWSLGRPVR